MEQSTVRTFAMWIMLLSGVLWLVASSALQLALAGMTRSGNPNQGAFGEQVSISVGTPFLLNLILGAGHTISMLVFVILLHRDLMSCERWVSFERSRLVSGEMAPLSTDPGAGAVGAPGPSSANS